MRRPVKPFVTEYKGNGRRAKETRAETEPEDGKRKTSESKAKDVPPPPKRGAIPEARGPLPPRGLFRGSADPEPIDSYEAAMRAADALFSPRTASGQPSSGEARVEQPANAGASPSTGSQGRLIDDTDAARGAAGEPAEPTGRVLRALDEPAPPEPMPEPAPKRRGRKPGSLNKPKVPGVTRPRAIEDGAGGHGAFAAPPTAPMDAMPETVHDDMAEMEELSSPEIADDARVPPGLPSEMRRRDRFPWVRTKLQPGEKWKRRLPRVAW